MRQHFPALLLAACAIFPPELRAQDFTAPHDTIEVQVGSRASQSLGSATRAVEVIDRQMIARSGARSVAEALAWGFGVDVSPYSSALADVGIRGSTFEQLLVLVDGVRVRDAQTGHFNLNLSVPLEQVEKIEILRGPAAALYGSDAMAGVINIVTRAPARSSSSLSLAAGSFAYKSVAATQELRLSQTSGIDLGVSFDDGDGHRNGTDFENALGRISAAAKIGGQPVKAALSYARRRFGADGFYGAYPAFETTRTTTASLTADVVGVGGTSFQPSVSWRRNTDDFILYRDEPARYRNRHTTNHVGADLIGRVELGRNLRAAVGVHAYQDQIESAALGNHSEALSALSIEIASVPTTALRGSVGLRGELAPGGEILLAPGASAGWSPNSSLNLRTSFGIAHRLPTWTERYYRDPIHEGSAELAGEQAWSLDAGIDVYLFDSVKVSGSAFVRREHDLIDWAKPLEGGDPIWRTRNVDRASFRGLEAEIALPEVYATTLRGQGSWLTVESTSDVGLLSKYALRPQAESVALLLDHRHGEALMLSLRGARERRVGERPYLKVDGRLTLERSVAQIHLDFANLTEADYLDVTRHAAPGRSIALGVEFRR